MHQDPIAVLHAELRQTARRRLDAGVEIRPMSRWYRARSARDGQETAAPSGPADAPDWRSGSA